jgi:hypothetical protein
MGRGRLLLTAPAERSGNVRVIDGVWSRKEGPEMYGILIDMGVVGR